MFRVEGPGFRFQGLGYKPGDTTSLSSARLPGMPAGDAKERGACQQGHTDQMRGQVRLLTTPEADPAIFPHSAAHRRCCTTCPPPQIPFLLSTASRVDGGVGEAGGVAGGQRTITSLVPSKETACGTCRLASLIAWLSAAGGLFEPQSFMSIVASRQQPLHLRPRNPGSNITPLHHSATLARSAHWRAAPQVAGGHKPLARGLPDARPCLGTWCKTQDAASPSQDSREKPGAS